jgi:hypothetical protein
VFCVWLLSFALSLVAGEWDSNPCYRRERAMQGCFE